MKVSTSKIHLIGIGGYGMSPLAEFCHERGDEVSGSDMASSTNLERLCSLGIKAADFHDVKHIEKNMKVVCSSAIPKDNPELMKAEELGLEVWHRSDLLEDVSRGKKLIGISGTHGKTTTSSMIFSTLLKVGLDPSGIVGGELSEYKKAHHLGEGDYFVAELDESDGSFLKFNPYISVVTNVDLDHMDHYEDMDHIKETYRKFVENTHEDGVVVMGWDTAEAREVAENLEHDVLSYGFATGSDIRCYEYRSLEGRTDLKVLAVDTRLEFTIPTIGKHNVQNALAVIAIAKALDLSLDEVVKGLSKFKGVKRRTNLVYDSNGVTIIDDYAHNPGKIASFLQGVKSSWPDRKVIALFQPQRYTRTRDLFEEFSESFVSCDEAHIFPIFSAGESAIEGITSENLASQIRKKSCKNTFSPKSMESFLKSFSIQKGTILATIGAGDIWKLAENLRRGLNE